ncbi:MAG: DNA-directed DNA polymerase [Candidatus Hydrogenedentota bacterium]
MSAGFVHLHVHTEYSVLDGASKVKELIERCKQYGMHACALTDHGAMFGAIDFYKAAKDAGIKPIIGCELYVAKNGMADRSSRSGNYNHFLTLCENEEGYHNLCKLSSAGYTEGFYYKPRVDMEMIQRHKTGLIATSSCLAGEIPQLLLEDRVEEARQSLEKFLDIFGPDHFLIEIQDHGMAEDRKVNPRLVEFAERYGLTLIATNDSHYTDKTDAEAHDALLAIQTGATLDEENRFKFPTNDFFFCSPEEMRLKFKDHPQALINTEKIAARCNVELKLGQHLIPEYTPPEGMSKVDYLHSLVMLGLEDRFDGRPNPEHIARAEFELNVINGMKFTDYFLVVWDLINFARSKGIPVGPGRGSGAGSLVAYALKITNIDPIRYQLLFERFLNPDRVSMPDFDIDFCFNRRGEVIEYTRAKYGTDNVCQIITFGRMLAKAAIRNVGRVMGMPYGDVDRIAKLVPEELKITLKDAYEKEPQIKQLVENDPAIKKLWDLATRLEGTIGNCGTHAAGVVICDKPLTDYVPLFKASGSDVVATQFEMKYVEEVGLLKMDYLGLRTLTVVHEATRLIRENRDIHLDIDNLEPNDPNAYAVLRSGKTTGIFQLESSGMRDLAKRIGLESLEEICALVALYRPGPMELKDDYIANKHHPERIKYDHPLLEPILKETYGVALYQEQVMQIVQAVAGFSLGQADLLRRAMGKKKADLMAQQRAKFVEGAVSTNNLDKKLAEQLFDRIEQFAGYGFNKSHSMAYAYVAYQTAYLKANYPVEFMTALLTSESGNLVKVGQYIEEARRMGIEVLPPDVNSSCLDFTVERNRIRFGLGTIKNVGTGHVDAIVSERENAGPYKDIYDFCKRIDLRLINKRVLESLNKAGAFDETKWNRRQVDHAIEQAMNEGQASQRDRDIGQISIFDMGADTAITDQQHEKPKLDEWPESELLTLEKEMLGLYVSSHPLARYAPVLERFTSAHISSFDQLREGQEVVIGGMFGNIKHHTTAKGKKMAFATLETLEGPVELTVFSELYAEKFGLLVPERAVMITGKINYRNEEPGLVASDIIPIGDAEDKLTKAVHVRVNCIGLDDDILERLATLFGHHEGKCDVYLHCITPAHEEVVVHATSACRVAPSDILKAEVQDLLGESAMWYTGHNGYPHHGEE